MYNQAGFTLAGVYNYFENIEAPLFHSITLYNGGTFAPGTTEEQTIPPINKDILIEELIEDWGEMYCWRQDPNKFKLLTNKFFSKNYDNFAKMWTALHLDYNPIFNYDRKEDSKETYNSYTEETDRRTWTDETNETPTGTETRATTHASNEVVEKKVSADNVTTYSPSEQVTTTLAPDSETTSFTNRNTKVETQRKNPGGTDKNDHKGHDDHTAYMRGNIGTTRTQEMILDELNLREYDFYRMVADRYAHEMLLLIY